MNPLPQHSPPRATRIQLGEGIPAVLRNPEGGCNQASLKTVSLTGGLLSVPQELDEGSSQKLMFVTHTGSVLGTAKMLAPVSSHLQPFEFVSLHQNDKRKLGEAIRTCIEPDDSRTQWIEKYRVAAEKHSQHKQDRTKKILTISAMVALGLAGLFYYLHV
jgi:hypothetical protein